MKAHLNEKEVKQMEHKANTENIKKNFNWKLLIALIAMFLLSGAGGYALISLARHTWTGFLNIGLGILIGVIATFVVLVFAVKKTGTSPVAAMGLDPNMVQGKCVEVRTGKITNPQTKQKETIYTPVYEVTVGNKYMKVMGKQTKTPPKVGDICYIKM